MEGTSVVVEFVYDVVSDEAQAQTQTQASEACSITSRLPNGTTAALYLDGDLLLTTGPLRARARS
jgi:hypothetical protein